MTKTLIPWTTRFPLGLSVFGQEMDELMNRLFDSNAGGDSIESFAPHTNVAETENGYEVSVDLPGMKVEDVHVEYKDGELWIAGERKSETEQRDKTFHRVERRYGSFRRVIRLPEADESKIDAEYKDGVLRINLPKAEATRPKRIAVKG